MLASAPVWAQPGSKITVHVKDLTAEKVYLGFYMGDATLMKDSAEVVRGTATFQSDTLLPQGMYLVVMPPEMTFFDLFLDEDQVFSMETDLNDLVGEMEVKGSKVNSVFYNDIRFLQEQQALISSMEEALNSIEDEDKRSTLQTQIKTAQTAVTDHRRELIAKEPDLLYSRFLKAVKGPDLPETPEGEDEYWQFFYFRAHYFDEVNLSDPAMLRTPIVESKVMDYIEKYTVQDPDSLIKAIDLVLELASKNEETFQHYLSTLFNQYVESKLMGAEPVMIHLAQTYYLTGKAPWASEKYLDELRTYVRDRVGTLVGDKGKDFTILDLKDQPTRLYDIKAPLIVLYFWSYDCATCKKVTPKLAELMPSYLEQGVKLVSVCTNGTREEWKGKVAEYGLPGIALSDPSRQSGFDDAYNIISTPIIYVLDSEFIIRYKQISVEDLGAVLDFELKR